MPLESPTVKRTEAPGFENLAIIDCDVHNGNGDPRAGEYLSRRWRTYVETLGMRSHGYQQVLPQRAGVARWDAYPPSGGAPGSDPDFAREQLLDEYGMTAAILNNLGSLSTGNMPAGLEIELARATNEYNHDYWLQSGPRWRASTNVPFEEPTVAAEEIARCRHRDDRYVQVIVGSRAERPLGNQRYWPIYEAAVHYDVPVAFHVGAIRSSQNSACAMPSFYFELHSSFPTHCLSLVSSLIFEGAFDRFPNLKVVITELGWAWVIPFAWRLESTWRVMKDEVPHLQRRPTEYVAEHLWFTTQPPRSRNIRNSSSHCTSAWNGSAWERSSFSRRTIPIGTSTRPLRPRRRGYPARSRPRSSPTMPALCTAFR